MVRQANRIGGLVACVGLALAGPAASASDRNDWLIVNEDNDHYFRLP